MSKLLVNLVDTQNISSDEELVRKIEKLRLDHFLEMVRSTKSFTTKVRGDETQYTVDILRRRFFGWDNLGTFKREIDPKKKYLYHSLSYQLDIQEKAMLTGLYRTALVNALSVYGQVPSLDNHLRRAVNNISLPLACAIQAFPVDYDEENDHFTVVTAREALTADELKAAQFIWPEVSIEVSNSDTYSYIRAMGHLFFEWHFVSPESPYGTEVNTCRC